MQKDKTEQLKEVLNHSLSSKDIQEKLKEETKYLKEHKQKKNKNFNLILYIASVVTILLLIISIYLFIKDNSKADKPQKEDIKKEIVKKEEPQKEIVKKEKIQKNQAQKAVEQKVEAKKEKVIIKKETIVKEVILEKGNFNKFYNSLKFNTLKCYNFKTAKARPDNTCIKQLKPFLEKNKDAIRFEVIPVMAETDNQLFEGMKKTLDNSNEKYVQKVKEYMRRGLSTQRVIEVTWHIKEILGKDVIITPTNYYAKSVKNNKGVIIKAYH